MDQLVFDSSDTSTNSEGKRLQCGRNSIWSFQGPIIHQQCVQWGKRWRVTPPQHSYRVWVTLWILLVSVGPHSKKEHTSFFFQKSNRVWVSLFHYFYTTCLETYFSLVKKKKENCSNFRQNEAQAQKSLTNCYHYQKCHWKKRFRAIVLLSSCSCHRGQSLEFGAALSKIWHLALCPCLALKSDQQVEVNMIHIDFSNTFRQILADKIRKLSP